MKFSRFVTGMLSVALLAFMVSDTLGQEQGRRGGDRGGRGGPGGFQGRGGGPGGFQGRGGGPGGFQGGRGGGDITMALLRSEQVKAELQIAPEQEEALQKLAEQGRGERGERGERGGGFNFQEMTDEQRREFFEQRQKEQQERTAKMKEQLEEVLLPEQMERLEQIAMQIRGVQALNDQQVQANLNFTTAQKEKLEQVRTDLQQKMREEMQALFGGGDRTGIQEKMAKLGEEMQAEVLAVLTSEQQKQFNEMKGEPFEIPEAFRRGFGGRGGPGGGRGGPGGGRGFGGRGGEGGGPGGGRGRRERPEAE